MDHVAQLCEPRSRGGDHRPLAAAQAGRADAYNQLPLQEEDRLTAVATLRRATRKARYGFIPRTQSFRPTAAVLRTFCSSGALAALVRRFLKIPRVGDYDNYGMGPVYKLVDAALGASTSSKHRLEVILKQGESDAGKEIEFPGAPHCSRKNIREP